MNECTYNLRPADPRYQRLVNNITDELKMHRIEVYESDTDNACATLYTGHGYETPVITYNEEFLDEVWEQGEWAVVGLFVHEVGHHYNLDLRNPSVSSQHSHRKELNADRLVGYMLRCEGATLAQAKSLYPILSKNASWSHPGHVVRMSEVEEGWRQADCRYVPQKRVARPKPVPASNSDGLEALLAVAAVGLIGIGIAAIFSD